MNPDTIRRKPPEPKLDLTQFGDKQYDVSALEYAAQQTKEIQHLNISDPAAIADVLHSKYWRTSSGESIGPSDLLAAYTETRDWMQVIEQHPTWKEHVEKVLAADKHQEYPVLLYQGTLIDGIHRLTRAVADRAPSIPAYVLAELPAEAEYHA